MEIGESAEETARRELLEETGLKVDELELFDVFSGRDLYYKYPTGEEVYNVTIVYLGKGTNGSIQLEDGEHMDFCYFDLAEIPDEISPPIKPILQRLNEPSKND